MISSGLAAVAIILMLMGLPQLSMLLNSIAIIFIFVRRKNG